MSVWRGVCSCFETIEIGDDDGEEEGKRILLFNPRGRSLENIGESHDGCSKSNLTTWVEASTIIVSVSLSEELVLHSSFSSSSPEELLDSSSSSSSSLLVLGYDIGFSYGSLAHMYFQSKPSFDRISGDLHPGYH